MKEPNEDILRPALLTTRAYAQNQVIMRAWLDPMFMLGADYFILELEGRRAVPLLSLRERWILQVADAILHSEGELIQL